MCFVGDKGQPGISVIPPESVDLTGFMERELDITYWYIDNNLFEPLSENRKLIHCDFISFDDVEKYYDCLGDPGELIKCASVIPVIHKDCSEWSDIDVALYLDPNAKPVDYCTRASSYEILIENKLNNDYRHTTYRISAQAIVNNESEDNKACISKKYLSNI